MKSTNCPQLLGTSCYFKRENLLKLSFTLHWSDKIALKSHKVCHNSLSIQFIFKISKTKSGIEMPRRLIAACFVRAIQYSSNWNLWSHPVLLHLAPYLITRWTLHLTRELPLVTTAVSYSITAADYTGQVMDNMLILNYISGLQDSNFVFFIPN